MTGFDNFLKVVKSHPDCITTKNGFIIGLHVMISELYLNNRGIRILPQRVPQLNHKYHHNHSFPSQQFKMKPTKFKQLPKEVYHGTISYEKQYLSLTNINTIDLTKGNKKADFGQGFYVTSIIEQALAFARYRTNSINDYEVRLEKPIIVKYQLDINLIKEFKGKIFPYPNEEWAEFVYNNRVGEKFAISNSHNIDQKYDYVYGHVADGKVAAIANQYKYDRIDMSWFCQQIQPKFPTRNDQLSFHTNRTLTCLKFLEVIEDDSYCYHRR